MELKSQVITRILLAHILLSFVSLDALQAEEFHVTTAVEFQNALTSARDNSEDDTIWLAAGTYNASDIFSGFIYLPKEYFALTIKGEEGTTAEDVILDGNDEYTVLSVEEGYSSSISIEGITVRNGVRGISVTNTDGDIILMNNKIVGNNNTDTSGCGGGVYVSGYYGDPILINNIIKNNTASCGGGVYVILSSANVILINNIITGNKAENDSSTMGDGGGVYVDFYEPHFIPMITLTNNTITENEASQKGGGLYLNPKEDNIVHIYNNIIWGNEGSEGKDIYNNSHIYSYAYFHNNNIHDKAGRPFTDDVNNMDDDPLFVNAEQGDYRLLPDSPCIDKGTSDAPELPSTDFEGDSRTMGTAPDIGADELDPSAPPTTTTITGVCPSEQIYGEHSEETELLRYIRDNVLSQTPEGREIIRLYYQWSPIIVQAMEEDGEFKEEVNELIDGVLELITETE